MKTFDKDIYKKVIKISFPAICGFLGLIFFDLIDIYWIEKLGTQAVAGVSSAGFVVWTLYALIQISSAGCASLVAKFHGASKRRRAWEVIIQSTWMSIFISAVVCIICIPNIHKPFSWMGLDTESTSLAISYFLIILYGFPIIFLDMLSGQIFNSYGDNKLSNVIMLGSLFINIVLDPVLMFGWYFFPKMGTAGAAWATVISHFVSLLFRLYYLRKRNYIPPLRNYFRFRTFYYKNIVKIGVPNAITACVWSLIYPVLTRLITPFGMIPVSAVGIGHRLESFPYFVAMAFGVAMTTLVGHSIGAKEEEKIDQIVSAGLRISSLIILPFVLLFILFPFWIMQQMSNDPALILDGADYLYIIGMLEIFMSWEMVLSGVFTGLGMTYPTLLITLPFTIGRVPIAWFLAYYLDMGVKGIWWSISATTFFKGFGLYLLYIFYIKRITKNKLQTKNANNPNK